MGSPLLEIPEQHLNYGGGAEERFSMDTRTAPTKASTAPEADMIAQWCENKPTKD